MDYRSLSYERKSERDFRKKQVPGKALEEIKKYFKECRKLIPDIDVELKIFNREAKEALDGISGYKGFMIEAPCYLVLLSEEKDHYIENSGFIGEDLVLKATELELDSCWVTFDNEERAKEALEIDSEKEITALIALGYEEPEFKKRKIDIKRMSEVEVQDLEEYRAPRVPMNEFVHTKVWNGETPLAKVADSALMDAFESARHAPTYLNKQPYRFILDDNRVVLAARKDADTAEEITKLGAGIIMLHMSGVISQVVKEITWNMGVLEKDYQLPKEYSVAAWFDIE